MNDTEYIRHMDRRISEPPQARQGLYPYRMRVMVTQEWDLDIMADSEDDAYSEIETRLKSKNWQTDAELSDEKTEATHAFEQGEW